jgi:peptidylprolyl isomerase
MQGKSKGPQLRGDGCVISGTVCCCLAFFLVLLPILLPWDALRYLPYLRWTGAFALLVTLMWNVTYSVPVSAADFALYEQMYIPPLGRPNPNNPLVFLDISIGGEATGRIEIELKADVVPITASKILQFCTNRDTGDGPVPSYRDSTFHRVIKGFMCQGGAIQGHSIRAFNDEWLPDGLDLLHNGPGVLSMANRGPNTNSSQFFICVRPCGGLDRKHVVFGQVVRGFDVVMAMESVGGSSWNFLGLTSQPVVIVDCGAVERT